MPTDTMAYDKKTSDSWSQARKPFVLRYASQSSTRIACRPPEPSPTRSWLARCRRRWSSSGWWHALRNRPTGSEFLLDATSRGRCSVCHRCHDVREEYSPFGKRVATLSDESVVLDSDATGGDRWRDSVGSGLEEIAVLLWTQPLHLSRAAGKPTGPVSGPLTISKCAGAITRRWKSCAKSTVSSSVVSEFHQLEVELLSENIL